ncbi:GNAT family N-acetyltransferase [Pelomyxa schiedti]|nr:GNAT family N-acetyltransferase [Pelomyxa schiedti]
MSCPMEFVVFTSPADLLATTGWGSPLDTPPSPHDRTPQQTHHLEAEVECSLPHGVLLRIIAALQNSSQRAANACASDTTSVGASASESSRRKPLFAAIRVPGGGSVLSVLVMTPPWHLILTCTKGSTVQDVMSFAAENVFKLGIHVPGILGTKECISAFAPVWCNLQGGSGAVTMKETLYYTTAVNQPNPMPSGHMEVCQPHHTALVGQWMTEFMQESLPHEPAERAQEAVSDAKNKVPKGQQFMWIVTSADGQNLPVAMAGFTRETPNGIAIGNVYTPPNHRRNGYAAALTYTLTKKLLDGGKAFVSLYADVNNPTSNGIYQKVGFVPSSNWDFYVFAP